MGASGQKPEPVHNWGDVLECVLIGTVLLVGAMVLSCLLTCSMALRLAWAVFGLPLRVWRWVGGGR